MDKLIFGSMLAFALLCQPAGARAQQAPKEPVETVDRAPTQRAEAAPAEKPTLPKPDANRDATRPDASTAEGPSKPDPSKNSPANTAVPQSVRPKQEMDHGVPDDYRIGAGDVLHISVWKEPEASVPSVVVRPDGKISMAMIKEVSVVGLTPLEAEKVITEQLTNFISAPDVTVIVMQINSKKIYLVGAVKREGPMQYTYRMTALQALSEAGGLTDYAKKKKIYILRHENGRDYKLPFDYDAVLRGEHMETNVVLQPGDTMVVPK